MPLRVPRPQESTFQAPTPSLEAFGGGESTARSFQAAGGLARQQEIMEGSKLESALQTAADEKLNELTAEKTRLTLAMRQARGKDAFTAASQALKDYDKFTSDLDRTIGNDVVKQYVRQASGKHRLHLEEAGKLWSNAEGERWQDETDEAKWTNNRNAAIANPTPQQIGDSIADTNRSLEHFAARKGMPSEWLQGQKDKLASATHYGVLDTMLAGGNDLAAKTYFEANKDGFKGNDLIHAQKMLKAGSTTGEAYRLSDIVMSYEPTTVQDAMAHLEKLTEDTGVLKEAESRIRQKFHDIAVSVEQRSEAVFADISKRMEQNPGVDPKGLATPDEWENKLTPKDRDSLKRLAHRDRETDPAVFTSMMSVPLPQLAKYTDAQMLSQFGAHMTIADYEKALNRRDTARKGGPAYDATAQHDATIMSVFVKSGLGGVKPSDTVAEIQKDDKKQAAFMKFWETTETGRLAEQHATGKKADDETTLRVANKAALFLQKKVPIIRREGAFGVEYLADKALGRKQVQMAELLSDPDMATQELEMPQEFSQALFNRAKSRPGTVPQGMEFATWWEKERAGINRAYLSFLAGATSEEAFASYLKGK